MKKYTILALFLSVAMHAQGVDAVNKIYPPAPTANNLMKFEETPVSTYTGVPDISLPIYTLSAGKIQIPINLSYHILSSKPDDFASEAGLGWSLLAGGTISRTVKGLPDEAIKDNLGSGRQGIGIYIDEYSSHPNFIGTYRNYTASYLNMISNNGNPFNEPSFRKTAFEAAAANRYDTQYDLYQYNFLGNTGRFIIKKNSSNTFEVVKLDKNNLKITSQHNNKYEPVSFTIIDDQGRKYIFDVVEKTERSFFTDKTSQLSNSGSQSVIGQIDAYNSSFHISAVKDDNDQELVSFQYNPLQNINLSNTTRTSNSPVYAQNYESLIAGQIDSCLPPRSQSYTTNTSNKIRTLSRIKVLDGGIVDFIYAGGREDTGFSVLPYKLSEIQIKDHNERITEKVSLAHQYSSFTLPSELPKNRMKLVEINRKNGQDNLISKYKLDYYGSSGEMAEDPWGYFKCNYIRSNYGNNGCSDFDVLKSITYPTGGKTEFVYETNTFSYMSNGGNTEMPLITDFTGNPDNWTNEMGGVSYTKFKGAEQYFFNIGTAQDVIFNYNVSSLPAGTDWRLELLKGDGALIDYNPAYKIGTLYSGASGQQGTVTLHMEPGYYHARLDTDDAGMMFQTFNPVSVSASYGAYNPASPSKFLYGGGIRIKNIQYKDSDGSVSKQKYYAYTDSTDPSKSTGSLVFPVPVKNYPDNLVTKLWYTITDTNYGNIDYNNTFRASSTDNILPVMKTRGGDVGYENVSVFETDKGKAVSYYKSPRFYPNSDTVPTAPPFPPITDEDYKRGWLTKEEIKDNNNALLIQKSLDYDTQTSTIYTGILFRSATQNPYISEYDTYEDFLYYKQNCGTSLAGIKCAKIENVSDFPIEYSTEKSVLARVNQTGTETKEFFGSSYQLRKEKTDYNILDLPVKVKTTFPDNNIQETIYSYAQEKGNQLMISKNIVAVPLETESRQTVDGITKTLSKSQTVYPSSSVTAQTGNLVLPLSVKSYDVLNNSATTEVTYDQYDSKGNLQQYTAKDGVSVTIIWGYNGTQPIAKIEGAKLSDIQQSLTSSIVNASNTDASAAPGNDETSLLQALDAFRKDSSLAGYQISTYTYDPQIGVRSITPPSGIRELYKYDTANRLEKVIDVNGKVLKEFKYNYKN